MSIRLRTSQLFTRWKPAPVQVDDQQRLEQQLNQITDSIEFGPVPGAYFPFYWNIRSEGAQIIPDGVIATYCLPTGYQGQESSDQVHQLRTFGMVPIYIGVHIDQGSLFFVIETEDVKVSDGVGGFKYVQGDVLHATNTLVNLGGPPPFEEEYKMWDTGLAPVDPDTGNLLGLCVRFEQTVDFPTTPVRGYDTVQLRIFDVFETTRISAVMIFKELSKVDNYRQG